MTATGYVLALGWRRRPNGKWSHPRRRGSHSLEHAVKVAIEERRAMLEFEAAYQGALAFTAESAPAVVVNCPRRADEPEPVVTAPEEPWDMAAMDPSTVEGMAAVQHLFVEPPKPQPKRKKPPPNPRVKKPGRTHPKAIVGKPETFASNRLTLAEKKKRVLPMLLGAGNRREECVKYEDHMDVAAKLNISARCPADCAEFRAYDRAAWVSYLARSQRAE